MIRNSLGRWRRVGSAAPVIGAAAAMLAFGSSAAQAQDLVHRFVDPSFGGNPFYSDHLLAIAAIDRPAAPTTPTTTQTQEELIAQQLRAQLLSQLSGNILDQIQNAPVGGTGNFEFGNQKVSYTRTATGTTVTFTNTDTGQVNTVVIPASSTTGTAAATAAATADARLAASANTTLGTLAAAAIPQGGTLTAGASAAALGRAPASASGSTSAEQALLASSGAAGGSAVLPPY